MVRAPSPIEEAECAGFDLSLIDESLSRSYENRALYHQAALNLALEAGESVINITRLLQRLCDADIDFVIVDGFAATLHGSSMVTRDLHVCAILSNENVARLRAIRQKQNEKEQE